MTTHQEIYDKIVNHLRQQGCKSTDGATCLYRGSNGTKCAAGCLISDEEYDPMMDYMGEGGASWKLGIRYNFPSIYAKYIEFADIIHELQIIHDMEEIQTWESEFKDLAHRYKLNYLTP